MTAERAFDVLIVGGGIGGIAAALECSRSGLRAAIVEKTILWGGLCTSGLVPVYMPLCDGRGRQVTFGIAEELLKASIKYGPGDIPDPWHSRAGGPAEEDPRLDPLYAEGSIGKRYATAYSPVAFALALDEVLEASGAELWLDTLACVPVMVGSKVAGIEVENKSGRITLTAACVIDGTGDADIACRAGAACDEGRSYPSVLYQYVSLALAREAVARGSGSRMVMWTGGGANEWSQGYDGPSPRLSGTRGKDVSAFVMESRRIVRQALVEQQAAEREGRKNIYPVTLPTTAQFRMTRTIRGHETVSENRCNQRCDTSVGLIADCRKRAAVWEVPYGALVPKGVHNLLVAGRCIAAEGYAWQVARLIQAAALTGQVAGIAATLAIRGKTSPDKLDVKDVQSAAEQKGIVLHL